jgi:hypothetical protein
MIDSLLLTLVTLDGGRLENLKTGVAANERRWPQIGFWRRMFGLICLEAAHCSQLSKDGCSSRVYAISVNLSRRAVDLRLRVWVLAKSQSPIAKSASRLAPRKLDASSFLERAHIRQELAIRPRLAELINQQFHRFHG